REEAEFIGRILPVHLQVLRAAAGFWFGRDCERFREMLAKMKVDAAEAEILIANNNLSRQAAMRTLDRLTWVSYLKQYVEGRSRISADAQKLSDKLFLNNPEAVLLLDTIPMSAGLSALLTGFGAFEDRLFRQGVIRS